MKKIRVLLADDHALIRAGIRALLEKVERIEVVGEAGDGPQALELIENLRPDVMLLDLTMPGLSGFEVLKTTSEKFPEVRTIVLTVHEEEEYAFHALRSGAAGYLPKSAASAELSLAIEHVMGGRKYLSPSIEQKAASRSDQHQPEGQPVPAELLAPEVRRVRRRSDVRRGVIWTMVGLGLMVWLAAVNDWEGGVWSFGLIPFLIGLGYLIVWKLEGKKEIPPPPPRP